jgi:uracil-DNA glycosylase
MKRILFVGLSNKAGRNPLDSKTATGKLIDKIAVAITGAEIYKTNLVDYAPLDVKGKLRYPAKKEIENAFPRLADKIKEIKPDVVVSLGKLASNYLAGKVQNHVAISHPSFISIYRRKYIDEYIKDSAKKIMTVMR